MSARAAWRLENLGFAKVCRYTPGKADWAANCLPTEGKGVTGDRAGDLARRDAPTCGLRDRIGDVRERTRGDKWYACGVVTDQRVLLGRLSRKVLEESPPDAVAEDVMALGPVTKRPNETLDSMRQFFERKKSVSTVWVTTSDAVLVGLLHREDVERKVQEREGAH